MKVEKARDEDCSPGWSLCVRAESNRTAVYAPGVILFSSISLLTHPGPYSPIETHLSTQVFPTEARGNENGLTATANTLEVNLTLQL